MGPSFDFAPDRSRCDDARPSQKRSQGCGIAYRAFTFSPASTAARFTSVTSDLVQRVWQHKADLVAGFTRRYSVHTLVWYEVHGTMESAIAREKAMKSWKRAWKLELIEAGNTQWRDLYPDIIR